MRSSAQSLMSVGLVALACGLQWRDGVYDMELTRHPDEPAHFVTALMVHDYLTAAVGSDPMAFAEEYYCRFPKVAFGHWPPGFHAALAGWMAVTRATPAAASLLIGVLGGLLAALLFARLRPLVGPGLAAASAAGFLTAAPVRAELDMVMVELPLALFVALAAFAYGDFAASGRFLHAAGFGAWAVAALLTKGNGLALALLPPLVALTTGRAAALRSPRLWLVGLAVGLLTGPLYYATLRMATAVGSRDDGPSAAYLGRNLAAVPAGAVEYFGLPLVGLGLLGALVGVAARPAPGAEGLRPAAGLAAAWVSAVLGFQIAVPISDQARYLLPAMPGLVVLAAVALRRAGDWAGSASPRLRHALPVAGGLAVAVAMAVPDVRPAAAGYRAAARSLPVSDAGVVVLIASDSRGEGAFVVERRMADPDRTGFVLRASKMLGDDSWTGKSYTPRFDSDEQLRRFLADTRVHYVAIDDSPYRRMYTPPPHHTRLAALVRRHPGDFVPVGEHPVAGGPGGRWEGTIAVYRCRAADGLPPGPVRIDLTRLLGREVGVGKP